MKLWQGLGYYSRARNLRRAARQIMEEHGGQFPDTYEGIRALAGVGDLCGGRVSSYLFAGGVLGWLVILPLMALFGGEMVLIPAGVSVINYFDVLRSSAAALVVICLVSTVVTFAATALSIRLTLRLLERRKRHG